MLNLKKVFAIAFIATFLSAIPLTLAISCQELVSVTYTIEVKDFAKPVKPGGGGKPSPTGYKLTGFKWLSLPITIKTNPGELGQDLVGPAIHASSEAWDDATSAELVNTYVVSSSVTLDGPTDDGVNEIVFGDIDNQNIIAQCTYWFYRRTKALVDFEIVFNTKYFTWGDATNPATSGVMDVQNIATHELGHGFGLADLYQDQYAELTMYGYGSAGEIQKRTLDPGDIAGIQALYG